MTVSSNAGSNFQDRVAQVRERLADRLRAFRLTPQRIVTVF